MNGIAFKEIGMKKDSKDQVEANMRLVVFLAKIPRHGLTA